MAFDQTTRNRLARFVSDARALLTEEFTRQLQNEYGLDPASGDVTPIDRLTALDDRQRETARILRETLDYYLAGNTHLDGKTYRDVLDRIVREQAFTVLNRLCALRMSEARGLVLESIAKGYESKGFQLYARLAGSALGETGESYRMYLFSLMDEFAVDLPVLFDRFSPQGRLFPRETALLKLLELINDPEIEPLWAEDETIGWIYQYFNSKEERKAMRDASQSPRNSRELAVRNQFFTPRYVVEFLTDNTLGRIWYEMTRGETVLKNTCRYLVRRPREIFLGNPHTTYGQDTPWVKSILENADFSAMPEKPSIEEIGGLALLIDGYSVAERIGYGDGMEHIERCLRALENDEPLPADSLELWLSLFACQRAYIREGDYSIAEDDQNSGRIRRVYVALRQTLQNPPEDFSQEELLLQPVYIPKRPLKDPREIKMLDPACGSMHFGLYAFDLFEQIYTEAWKLEERLGEDALQRLADLDSLHKTYPDQEAYLKDVPRLIIERNIHGVDIDPRAVQIAGLSLWLRAQKSWQEQGLRPSERPQIHKSNVVCAEPMPGDRQMLEEFLSTLRGDGLEALMRKAWHVPADQKVRTTPQMADALAKLVRTVWQEMELAGEAGSLLKIEETLRDAISSARKEAEEKSPLFSVLEYGVNDTPNEQFVQLVDGEDQGFFNRAEGLVLVALQEYAEKSHNEMGYTKRLFAEDAVQGFSFIDISRIKFDVVLMNPPFGECSPFLKEYALHNYPDSVYDLYCLFIERDLQMLNNNGYIGCITSSSFILYTDYSRFREQLLSNLYLTQLINLGDSVLDGAYVYTACYIIRKSNRQSNISFIDLRHNDHKSTVLLSTILNSESNKIRILNHDKFSSLPGSPLCHWIPDSLFKIIKDAPSLGAKLIDAGVGAAPQADFFNLWWEVPANELGFGKRWVRICNGGSFSPFFRSDYLVLDWKENGKRAIADLNNRYPYLNGNVGLRIQRTNFYGRMGITYGKKTDRFNAQILPNEQMFSFEGIGVFPEENNAITTLGILAFLNTRFVAYLLNLTSGLHKNDVYIRRLPFPLTTSQITELGIIAKKIIPLVVGALSIEESSPFYTGEFLFNPSAESIEALGKKYKIQDRISEKNYLELLSEIEFIVINAFQLDEALLLEIDYDQGPNICHLNNKEEIDKTATSKLFERLRPGFCRTEFENSTDLYRYCITHLVNPDQALDKLNKTEFIEDNTKIWFSASIISYTVGVVLGRWDIEFASGKKSYSQTPDPFLPLPTSQPGMLQNEQGLPAAPVDVPTDYPIRISWGGIVVDDEGHKEDIEIRIREVLQVLWKEHTEAIEQEVCQIISVRSLREYFRKPTLFFADHLKRYSKSRRAAPIYWPLSTISCSYTLWLYYHRLNDQTLYTCVNDFVDPKLKQVSEEAARLRLKKGRSAADEKELERLTDFERELKDFREELLRVAKFWKPNLNDGVEITAAPLWKLFQHKPWQKRLKETWQKLEAGEYDWAHLAYSIWPERVREKCKADKSLAIAHDLEELFVEPPASAKKKKAKKTTVDEETEGWFNDD